MTMTAATSRRTLLPVLPMPLMEALLLPSSASAPSPLARSDVEVPTVLVVVPPIPPGPAILRLAVSAAPREIAARPPASQALLGSAVTRDWRAPKQNDPDGK